MPLQSHHQALLLLENVQEERERVIEEEVLRRERLLLTPQSRMAWPPPSRLLKRHTPIRGPARPERAPSKGTVLPGSEPERDIPRNMGEHRRIAAQPQPRSRCLPRNRAAGREGCGLGAVRAARYKPSQGTVVCTPASLRNTKSVWVGPVDRFLEGCQSLHICVSFVACHRSLEERPLEGYPASGTPAAS